MLRPNVNTKNLVWKCNCICLGVLLFFSINSFVWSAPIRLIDDLGVELSLDQAAERVVLLGPNLVESIYAIDAAHTVVAVADHSDYPPEAREIPRVASHNTINYEKILALAPDLVVVWASGFGVEKIQKLRDLGLTVFASEPQRLADVELLLRTLGQLTGHSGSANQAALDYARGLEEFTQRYQHRRPVRVFYQIWHQPMQTLNDKHIVNDVITLCGGINIFAKQREIAPKVSVEAVIALDPELIITGVSDGQRPSWFDDWQRWPSITAVKKNQLFVVDADIMVRHAPRILLGAEQLCRYLVQARASDEVKGE